MPEKKIAIVCGCPFCTHTRNVIRWTLCFAAEEAKRRGLTDLDTHYTKVSEDWGTVETMKNSVACINDDDQPSMPLPTDGHTN